MNINKSILNKQKKQKNSYYLVKGGTNGGGVWVALMHLDAVHQRVSVSAVRVLMCMTRVPSARQPLRRRRSAVDMTVFAGALSPSVDVSLVADDRPLLAGVLERAVGDAERECEIESDLEEFDDGVHQTVLRSVMILWGRVVAGVTWLGCCCFTLLFLAVGVIYSYINKKNQFSY